MAELCPMMISHGYPPGLVFGQEHGVSRVLKDCQPFLANSGWRQELAGAEHLNLSPIQSRFMEQLEPISRLLELNWCAEIDSALRSPVIIDMQDSRPTLELFTFPTSEKPARHEEVLHFDASGSNNPEKALEDMPLLPNSMDVRGKVTSSLIYPYVNLYSRLPLVDFIGDLARDSKITIHPDGQVEFTGSMTEMNDLLSTVAEFYLSRNSAIWRMQSLLVPHFNRLNTEEAQVDSLRSSLKLEATTVPLKSPEKAKTRPSPLKKKGRKIGKERDVFRRNSFHACESLLSLLMDKKREGKSTILSLKKAGPELPGLLDRFSAGIAGTGIAVLFSVLCKVACARVPFCASKLMSTGLGFGLVWLSWAINRLSSTLAFLSRNTGKLRGLKEEEMMERVDKSLKEIYFRAATIMAVAALRLV